MSGLLLNGKNPKVCKKVTAIILSMLRALKVLHIMQAERSLAVTGEGDLWQVEDAVRAPGAYTHSLGRGGKGCLT